MDKRIVYQPPSGPAAILIPCDQNPLALDTIGRNDVPAGVPYWIVGSSTIPSDRSMRDAWELDVASMGEPDGYGGTYQEASE